MHKRFITVDLSKKQGRVKPLTGANLPSLSADADFSDEYRDMGVQFFRTLGNNGRGSSVVDICNVFPDFSLDERLEGSYNFTYADSFLGAIKACGGEIFLCLGNSRDKYCAAAYAARPRNYQKWAVVFEKIVAHYNNGWANGFKYGIKYVEIWPGVEDFDGSFLSKEDYFAFYTVVAKHLKTVFPRINVGAYSSGGFSSLNRFDASEKQRDYIKYLEDFLAYISNKNEKAPLDFLSWKCFAESPEEISLHSNYAKSYLQNWGFKRAKSIISEFNMLDINSEKCYMLRDYPARLASSLIIAQKSSVDMMLYSDMSAYSKANALFSLDDRVNKRYYASYEVMRAFAEIYRIGTLVESSEDYRREIYSLAAASDELAAILLVTRNYTGYVDISLGASSFSKYSIKGIIGGRERGEGYVSSVDNTPLCSDKVSLKVGSNEVYLIKLSR